MFSLPEKFSPATQANFEAQFAQSAALANKAFAASEKIAHLNLTVAKSTLEDFLASAKQLLTVKEPQEFFALVTAQAQPASEKITAYGRELAAIVSGVQADLSAAVESHIAETNGKVATLVDEVTKNAPAGSENAVAMLKSAMGNASAGYQQITKTSKQAAQAIEDNITAVTKQLAQAHQYSKH